MALSNDAGAYGVHLQPCFLQAEGYLLDFPTLKHWHYQIQMFRIARYKDDTHIKTNSTTEIQGWTFFPISQAGEWAKKMQAANLERVRNNQRRSRARRNEYLAELEGKVRSYESQGPQAHTDHKIQLLSRENEMLKMLLNSMGLGAEFLVAYKKAYELAPNWSHQNGNQVGDGAIPMKSRSCY